MSVALPRCVPMLRRYTKVVLRRPGNEGVPDRYVGRIPALPGCVVVGYCRDGVLEALERSGTDRLESLVRSGLPLPTPDLPVAFEGLVIDHTETV